MTNKYIIKVSGEAFIDAEKSLSEKAASKICNQIEMIINAGNKLAIVLGGGNIWRGRNSELISSIDADAIGMQSINLNAYLLYSMLKQRKIKTYLCSAISVENFIEPFDKNVAARYYNDGYVVVLGGGLGKPGISSDTALIQRAIDLESDKILMAKAGGALYDIFPFNEKSKIVKNITAKDLLIKQQMDNNIFIDNEAVELLDRSNISVFVYKHDDINALIKIFNGENPGTKIN